MIRPLYLPRSISLAPIGDGFVGATTVCPLRRTTFHDPDGFDEIDLRSVKILVELTVAMVFSPLVLVSAGAANSGVSGDPDVDIWHRW